MPVNDASDLYGLPIEEFTTARNDLAARLKAAGDADGAKRVKALKKPSVATWAVNQLARRFPDDVEEMLELRDAVEGASNAGELRSLSEQRRKVLAGLIARGRKVLEEGGHGLSSGTVDKISQTLLAAGAEDTRDRLVSGTLERELESTTSSFGAFGSFDASTVTFENEPDTPDPKIERARREAEAAERSAAELEASADDAEAVARTARDEASIAHKKAIAAREHFHKLAHDR